MSRDEFMRELEYLLQDIPDADKEDAIAYYRDYLEEAGPENEESVIREFGSPEKVAAIIRADLSGNLEQGGEFTDKGYEDERFKDPNYQIAPRLDLPEKQAGSEEKRDTQGFGQGTENSFGSAYGEEDRRFRYGEPEKESSNYGTERPAEECGKRRKARRRWEWWQIVLVCVAAPVLLPVILGIGGSALGLAFGVGSGAVGILIALVSVLACMAIALPVATLGILLAGMIMIIFGITRLSVLVQGILYIGTGIGLFGLGLLCLALCGLYYGKFLPWLVTAIVNFFGRLFHRKKVNA